MPTQRPHGHTTNGADRQAPTDTHIDNLILASIQRLKFYEGKSDETRALSPVSGPKGDGSRGTPKTAITARIRTLYRDFSARTDISGPPGKWKELSTKQNTVT